MKISEAIVGLAQTLRDKGDLDIWLCAQDKDNPKTLKSVPLVSGGWVNNSYNLPVAFLSTENLEGVVTNESLPSNQ